MKTLLLGALAILAVSMPLTQSAEARYWHHGYYHGYHHAYYYGPHRYWHHAYWGHGYWYPGFWGFAPY
jgi:hypothetical protein